MCNLPAATAGTRSREILFFNAETLCTPDCNAHLCDGSSTPVTSVVQRFRTTRGGPRPVHINRAGKGFKSKYVR